MNYNIVSDIEAELTGKSSSISEVHLRIQQRTARKSITIVENLNPELDLKKILKFMRKKFSCNGNIEKDNKFGKVIKLSGDQRENVKNFLVNFAKVVNKEDIIVHGF